MPFRTPLSVRHEVDEDWRLLEPLIFEGREEFFVVRSGFRTDFASIPRPVRWLFDTAGTNAEPGVLHDALWRESKRRDVTTPRVDPWDADGLFRRALRESGATVFTRALMWFAVRVAAIAAGRWGRRGPPWPLKAAQVGGVAALGAVTVGIPTAIAFLGRIFYWVVEWPIALAWSVIERAKGLQPNLPWPADHRHDEIEDPPREDLLIIDKSSVAGRSLAQILGPGDDRVVTDAEIDEILRLSRGR